jgi:hypothetical protein
VKRRVRRLEARAPPCPSPNLDPSNRRVLRAPSRGGRPLYACANRHATSESWSFFRRGPGLEQPVRPAAATPPSRDSRGSHGWGVRSRLDGGSTPNRAGRPVGSVHGSQGRPRAGTTPLVGRRPRDSRCLRRTLHAFQHGLQSPSGDASGYRSACWQTRSLTVLEGLAEPFSCAS